MSPHSSYNSDLSRLGNLSNGGNVTYASLNQGLAGGSSGNSPACTMPGSHASISNSGLCGSAATLPRSLSAGTETLAFAGTGSTGSPISFSSSNLNMSGAAGFVVNPLNPHGSANRLDQQELQPFQQHNAASSSLHPQEQLQQHQGQHIGLVRARQVFGMGMKQHMQGLAPVKVEQHLIGQQQLAVKMEPQVDSSLRQQLQHQQSQMLQGVGIIRQPEHTLHQQLCIPKMEMKPEMDLSNPMGQQSLITTHLQRQEALQLHKQQSQQFHAQMTLLQQQRLLQQHRSQLQQQQQQLQLQQHLRQLSSAVPKQLFEPGICAGRLMQYMFNQRQRPQDNNIHFWRRFVGEFFAHGAKKRWCVSQYGNNGRQPTGVFPQDVWHCEICGSRPGRGFETTVEVLPRLCKIKYDSGIVDELLFVDISNEYRLNSGFMVLEYGKAIQESIFQQLRVVREGQLRIIFTSELKIHLWEFCARGHEELLPRRILVPQVTQLAAIAQKYQNSVAQTQNGALSPSLQDLLQTNCQLFVGAARHLTRTLEAPMVNDLGYTKRYVRCLQISEVVNSMKDLIDFSRENRVGPIASLLNFPRRTVNFGETLRPQEPGVPQTQASGQNMRQAGMTIPNVNTSIVAVPPSGVGDNGMRLGSLPTILHQSMAAPLQNHRTHMNGTSPSINSSLTEVPTSSLTSLPQRTYLSGLPLSPASTFVPMGQQNALSSALNLLQSSGPFMHGNPSQENLNMAHRVQDLMISSSQLRPAGTTPDHHQQQGFSGGLAANAKLSAGLNAGSMGMEAENQMITPNLLGSSGHINEVLAGGGEGTVVGSAVSDSSDSGNLGAVSSSFSDGLMNTNFRSGNGNNALNLGSSLSSADHMENLMSSGGMCGSSVMVDEQGLGLAMQDPSQSFLNDYGSTDLLSSLGNSGFNSLPFTWKSP